MAQLEVDITNYRSDFSATESTPVKRDIPTLATYHLGPPSSDSTFGFGHSVQIKLIEPWGLKVNAWVNIEGATVAYDALSEYGVVVWHDTDNTLGGADMTVDQLLAKEDALVYSSLDGNIEPEKIDGYDMVTAKFDQGIYTYELDSNTYVMFYVKDDNGNYHYGAVKTRNLYDLMNERMNASGFGAKEKAVYSDMVNLYDAVTKYRNDYFKNN